MAHDSGAHLTWGLALAVWSTKSEVLIEEGTQNAYKKNKKNKRSAHAGSKDTRGKNERLGIKEYLKSVQVLRTRLTVYGV